MSQSYSTVRSEIDSMSLQDQIKVLKFGLSEALMELNNPVRSHVIDATIEQARKIKSEKVKHRKVA